MSVLRANSRRALSAMRGRSEMRTHDLPVMGMHAPVGKAMPDPPGKAKCDLPGKVRLDPLGKAMVHVVPVRSGDRSAVPGGR